MAEDDDKKKEEKEEKEIELNARQQKSYDKLAKAYEKAEKALKALNLAEDEAEKISEKRLVAIQRRLNDTTALALEVTRVKGSIDDLSLMLVDKTGKDKKELEKQIASEKAYLELIQKTIKSIDEAGTDPATKFFDDTLKSLNDFSSLFDTVGGKVIAQLTQQKLALAAIGIDMPNMYSEMRKVISELDDARRELIPFSRSIEDANALQAALAKRSKDSGISLTEIGTAAQSAAANFKMFNEGTVEARAEVSFFEAQLTKMGIKGGAGIIQSIITDSAAENAEVAIGTLKRMHVAMAELGAQPKQLYEDYQKLIGTFAMFGESAAANIGKVSFVAQKLEVDVGDITAFGDNFKGYTGAAKAAQTINAVFGRNIIDNPAELVRIFYTGGPGAALIHVREKLFNSGIDLEGMLSGPAGAARLQMLSGLFGVNNQTMGRMLGDRSINQAMLDNFVETGELADPSVFDKTVDGAIPQADKIRAGAEDLAVKFLGMLVGSDNVFGKIGDVIDGLTAETVGLFDQMLEEQMSPIIDKIQGIFLRVAEEGPLLPAEINASPPAAEGVDETSVEMRKAAEETATAAAALLKAGEELREASAAIKSFTPPAETGTSSDGPMQIAGNLTITGMHTATLEAIKKESSGTPQPRYGRG
jgi:hypothetical protein